MRIRRLQRNLVFGALSSLGVVACASAPSDEVAPEAVASSAAALWTDYAQIGSASAYAPAVTSWGPGRMDVFYTGSDGTVRHRWRDNLGTLSGEENLGGYLLGPPAAAAWGSNRLDIVGRDAGGGVTHKWFDGQWHDWESLSPGIGIAGSAPTISARSVGVLDVFTVVQGQLQHKWIDSSGWHNWENLGGTLTSDPAAVSWGPNRIDVVALGPKGQVLRKTFDGSWHDWDDLDGYLTTAPAIASWGPGRLDVFARGGDNGLWHRSFRNGAWYGWEGLGGVLGGQPTAVSWQQNEIGIFVRGGDGQIYQKAWTEPTFNLTGSQIAAVNAGGTWYFDKNGNQMWEAGTDLALTFGNKGDIPTKARSRGNTRDALATFNGGLWTVDTNGNGTVDSTDRTYRFGSPGDAPVSGNWSDTGIGVFNGGYWYLDTNGSGDWDERDEPRTLFGQAGDVPVVGDWTGDGTSKIGVFRNGTWFLDLDGNGTYTRPRFVLGPNPHWEGDTTFTFGGAGDVPVVGKWGPNGADAIGVIRTSTNDLGTTLGNWYLDTNGDRTWGKGDREIPGTGFGNKYTPVIGSFGIDIVPVMPCTDGIELVFNPISCGMQTNATLGSPLQVTLRTDANDASKTETTIYETEYLSTVDYRCNSTACPTSFELSAGQTPVMLAVGTRPVTVIGSGPLTSLDTTPSTTLRTGFRPVSHVYVKPWYAAPSDETISRWLDQASAQAQLVQGAVNLYSLTKSYTALASFNHDQLQILIDKVQLWMDAATGAEKLKWKGVLASLKSTLAGQPLPTDADPAAYLQEMVAQARLDMLLQASRAQSLLALFDQAQQQLDALVKQAEGDIDALLAKKGNAVRTGNSRAQTTLRPALAAVGNAG